MRVAGPATGDVVAAFARCRQIARSEAKNFYYAFVALPRAKSDGMCAMYAFMRRADDIADDERMPVRERRQLMAVWLRGFHDFAGTVAPNFVAQSAMTMVHPRVGVEQTEVPSGLLTEDDRLVFVAVQETQRRFGIGDELLDELVAGTAMDLAEELSEGVVRVGLTDGVEAAHPRPKSGTWGTQGEGAGRVLDCYETVEALDRYCYLVASVVGLVTVRIFGVQGTAADVEAVRMGKAFQYTNILRDVREDMERGRVYLPLEMLRAHGAGVEDVVAAAGGDAVSAGLQAAMEAMGARAEELYGARRGLLPLLARDSRPAMRVLIAIYHALLLKMRRRRYAVFAGRVRVSTARKLAILLRGMVGSFVGRFG